VAIPYASFRLGFNSWMDTTPPYDAPRIAFSLDDTWLNEIGVTDTTYQVVITQAGGRLVRFYPDDAPVDEVGALLDEREIDGVLLTGGGDVDPELYGGDTAAAIMVNRQRDDFEIALIHAARERGLPILGICRGAQILNVAMGGTLRNLRDDETLESAHFKFNGHSVKINQDSTLAQTLRERELESVYSFHGQAVDRPGDGVRVVATGPEDIVEAIELEGEDAWIVAVQWHPEMEPTDETQNRLFNAFITEARLARDARRQAPLP
jgi:putative glutamine amidotransferase